MRANGTATRSACQTLHGVRHKSSWRAGLREFGQVHHKAIQGKCCFFN